MYFRWLWACFLFIARFYWFVYLFVCSFICRLKNGRHSTSLAQSVFISQEESRVYGSAKWIENMSWASINWNWVKISHRTRESFLPILWYCISFDGISVAKKLCSFHLLRMRVFCCYTCSFVNEQSSTLAKLQSSTNWAQIVSFFPFLFRFFFMYVSAHGNGSRLWHTKPICAAWKVSVSQWNMMPERAFLHVSYKTLNIHLNTSTSLFWHALFICLNKFSPRNHFATNHQELCAYKLNIFSAMRTFFLLWNYLYHKVFCCKHLSTCNKREKNKKNELEEKRRKSRTKSEWED